MSFFEYTEKEVAHLIKKDKKLGEAIQKIGHINRSVNPDLFSSVVNSIIGQQISTSAHITVWNRLVELAKEVTPKSLEKLSIEDLQKCGMSFRKAEYIKNFSNSITNKEIILDDFPSKSDEEIIKILSSVKGIGVWTAEMILTFSLQRPNVLSYGDLAILKGMRMLYRHKKITPELFNKYKKRYSPYASVAALYFWAIAGGKIEGLTDPYVKPKK